MKTTAWSYVDLGTGRCAKLNAPVEFNPNDLPATLDSGSQERYEDIFKMLVDPEPVELDVYPDQAGIEFLERLAAESRKFGRWTNAPLRLLRDAPAIMFCERGERTFT